MNTSAVPLVVPVPTSKRRGIGAANTTTSSSATTTTTSMMIITTPVAPRVPSTRVGHPRGAVIRCARAVVVVVRLILVLVLVLVIVSVVVMDGAVDAGREEDEDDEGEEEGEDEVGGGGQRRGDHIEHFFPPSLLFGTVAGYLSYFPEENIGQSIVTKQTVWW